MSPPPCKLPVLRPESLGYRRDGGYEANPTSIVSPSFSRSPSSPCSSKLSFLRPESLSFRRDGGYVERLSVSPSLPSPSSPGDAARRGGAPRGRHRCGGEGGAGGCREFVISPRPSPAPRTALLRYSPLIYPGKSAVECLELRPDSLGAVHGSFPNSLQGGVGTSPDPPRPRILIIVAEIQKPRRLGRLRPRRCGVCTNKKVGNTKRIPHSSFLRLSPFPSFPLPLTNFRHSAPEV